jgi:hypothetical protein
MIAEIPNISSILAMFDPTTLPKAIAVLPDKALVTETTSSGVDVPNATTVNPITIGLIFSFRATADAPSTSKSAALTKMPRPTINSRKLKIIDLL